ncbi:DegT/DnrJ/EryC1/StrS aminotransferase family protein [Candidatus Woesebacteria bacterium]|nr:DegT/DnrJ/EryC1/StrS aminotransferase family protein [Candidatus Woesebacteria bacterium]
MIKLIKSTFYNEEDTKKKLTYFISNATQLSFGPQCQQFEKNFAKYQGAKDCVFLNSGSSANLAIIQALVNLGKLKPGDIVGFSALTWSTNPMPLIQLGLLALPIDVEMSTLNVSSKKLKEALDRYPIKAFFLTNLLGFCDDIDEIRVLCKKRNVLLIEDNCESLGTIYKGEKLGNFGIASTSSFYVGHHMSTIEGGAVCTNNMSLANMVRIVRAHGWDRNLSSANQNKIRSKFKVNSTFYSRYTFYDLGYNLRPTEINGFLGSLQLKYISEIVKKRNKNFFTMAKAIYSRTDRYFPVKYDHIEFLSNFAFPVVCKSVAIRDALVEKCSNKVEIRPIVGGDMTQQPFFKKHMNMFAHVLQQSNAELIHKQGLYVGNNPELTAKELQTIIHLFTS